MLIYRIHKTMATVAKKAKLGFTEKSQQDTASFVKNLQFARENTAKSVLDFFNKKRVQILSKVEVVPDYCKGIVYWMSRDCRSQDNWAFLFAQKLALKNQVPLHVCFCLYPKYTALRHFHFLLKGLEKVSTECKALDITFHLLKGSGPEVLPSWIAKNKIGAVVCDFEPLRVPLKMVEDLKETLNKDVPLIKVDAHNVVPCWIASDKQEYSARTIRNKINSKLEEFLTEYPPLIKHPYKSNLEAEKIDWESTISSIEADHTVKPVEWAKAGYEEGIKTLQHFIEHKLMYYAEKKNDPTEDVTSNLSPWFNFGQISPQRAVLCVEKYKHKFQRSVEVFLEEAVVRRELTDNFCFYNENYDSLKGANEWAQKTLNEHRKDKRAYIYTLEQLRDGQTHEDIWNSAQKQLVIDGKMHGFLRMYWCKKILEWTSCPEDALKYALYLNDHYSLDGVDPNGNVGCMWSICGVHDQGWPSRDIFGKIRYMNYAGCKRKFDIPAFVSRYPNKDTCINTMKNTKRKALKCK